MKPSALVPPAARIQTYTVSDDGRYVFVGIATAPRTKFFMRFKRAGLDSWKLSAIIGAWIDMAATHREPDACQ